MNINTKILVGIVILVILFGALFIFLQKQNQPIISPTVNQNVSANTINIQNFAFNPATITVKAGTTVTWINQDAATHRIKSDTFNSPDLSQGDNYVFTLNTKGSFDYSCGTHPSMTGKIVVE